jgi:uncharacterized membrane protein YeaQ/YmgE (transglycosylase-associated protein family)
MASLVFASLTPGGGITWLIIGLLAGFLASRIMGNSRYGCLGNILIGIVGAFIGGLLVALLFPGAYFHFWSSLLAAILGACLLIALLRAISRSAK